MITVRRIQRTDPLYQQQTMLRQSVLLAPIGYSFERFRAEYPAVDERGVHVVAVLQHPTGPKVVGTATLLPPSAEHEPIGKLTQMAVDPQRQHEGIGRRLVAELERIAFGELGLAELFCHAQVTASGFYSRLGWRIEGDTFTEAGIPHVKMRFHASPAAGSVEPDVTWDSSVEPDGT